MVSFRYCKKCGAKYNYTANKIKCKKCGEPTTGIKLQDGQVESQIFCPKCKIFKTLDNSICSYCKTPLITLENYHNNYAQYLQYYIKPKEIKSNSNTPNIPRCPTCGSTKVKKISTASKAIGFAMVGIFSSNLGKQMQCENCGYKW